MICERNSESDVSVVGKDTTVIATKYINISFAFCNILHYYTLSSSTLYGMKFGSPLFTTNASGSL